MLANRRYKQHSDSEAVFSISYYYLSSGQIKDFVHATDGRLDPEFLRVDWVIPRTSTKKCALVPLIGTHRNPRLDCFQSCPWKLSSKKWRDNNKLCYETPCYFIIVHLKLSIIFEIIFETPYDFERMLFYNCTSETQCYFQNHFRNTIWFWNKVSTFVQVSKRWIGVTLNCRSWCSSVSFLPFFHSQWSMG